MLTINRQVKNNLDLFQVPFGPILQWQDYIEIYPNIIIEMNGAVEENTLLFYFSHNPKDEEAEQDFASILGLDIHTISTGESKHELLDRQEEELRSQSLSSFYYDDNTILSKLANPDSISSIESLPESLHENTNISTKNAKKERRKQRLLVRLAATDII